MLPGRGLLAVLLRMLQGATLAAALLLSTILTWVPIISECMALQTRPCIRT